MAKTPEERPNPSRNVAGQRPAPKQPVAGSKQLPVAKPLVPAPNPAKTRQPIPINKPEPADLIVPLAELHSANRSDAPLLFLPDPPFFERYKPAIIAGGAGLGLLLAALIGIVAFSGKNQAEPKAELQRPPPQVPDVPPAALPKESRPFAPAPRGLPAIPARTEVPKQPPAEVDPGPPRARPTPTEPRTERPNVRAASSAPVAEKVRGPSLLVVSRAGAAAIRSHGTWTMLVTGPALPTKVNWCYVDRAGACWFCGEERLARFDGEKVESYGPANGLPTKPLSHIFEDSRGRMWVGSWGGGVAVREENRWRTLTTKDGLRHDDVNGCVEDHQGRIWVVGDAGVTLFAEGAFEKEGVGAQLTVNVKSLDRDAEGCIYLGCIGGLLIVERDLQTHVVKESPRGLPQKTPQAVFVDSRSRIWAGTWSGGVVELDRRTHEAVPESSLREARHVCRIAEDDSGVLWVGALEGLWKRESERWEKVAVPPPVADVQVVATMPEAIAAQLVALCGERNAAAGSAARPGVAPPGEPPPPLPRSSGTAQAPRVPASFKPLGWCDGIVAELGDGEKPEAIKIRLLGKSQQLLHGVSILESGLAGGTTFRLAPNVQIRSKSLPKFVDEKGEVRKPTAEEVAALRKPKGAVGYQAHYRDLPAKTIKFVAAVDSQDERKHIYVTEIIIQ